MKVQWKIYRRFLMDEARLEMIDRNKDRALQQKRMATIIQVAGVLGVDELDYIKNEIGDMISDIEKKKNANT
jgi:hypothetical protein